MNPWQLQVMIESLPLSDWLSLIKVGEPKALYILDELRGKSGVISVNEEVYAFLIFIQA